MPLSPSCAAFARVATTAAAQADCQAGRDAGKQRQALPDSSG